MTMTNPRMGARAYATRLAVVLMSQPWGAGAQAATN